MAQELIDAERTADVRRLAESFRLSLEAADKSPRTIGTYLPAVRLLADFLEDRGMPTAVSSISREHVESFVVRELERTSRTTTSIRYRALQQFFRWLVEEAR
jgi:site-specific recombinase XerD